MCDTIFEFTDPLEACRAVVSQAYSLWLQFEVRTDDITLIVAYIDHETGKAPRPASEQEVKGSASHRAHRSRSGRATSLQQRATFALPAAALIRCSRPGRVPTDSRAPCVPQVKEYEASLKLGKEMNGGTADGVSMGGSSAVAGGNDVKPVRRGVSASTRDCACSHAYA